jgi:dihydrofolate reductase
VSRIVVHMSVSADGFFEGPDGDLSWHRVDEEVHGYFNEVLRECGAFLDGRVTYELMVDFWPTADQDPESPAEMREFAAIWRDMPKFVYSRTLERAEWNTTVVREVVPEEVRELQARYPGDFALGGADLAASFQRLGLVDEWRLYVNPVVIGRGRRLFPDAWLDLQLVETRTFGNGVVMLRYVPDDQRPSLAR